MKNVDVFCDELCCHGLLTPTFVFLFPIFLQGTLGRQGSPAVLKTLTDQLERANKKYIVVLLSEILPGKLAQFKDVDAWIQVDIQTGCDSPKTC